MKIILEKDVPKLGRTGEIKLVADGFARNFLFMRRLAVPYSPGAEKSSKLRLESRAKTLKSQEKDALALKQKLEKLSLEFKVLVDDKGELYGSIGKGQILKTLRSKGVALPKSAELQLDAPLKTLGSFAVGLKLHSEVAAQIKVSVERNEPLAA